MPLIFSLYMILYDLQEKKEFFARAVDLQRIQPFVIVSVLLQLIQPNLISYLNDLFLRARNEPPDIDVDFEHERREEVMQYIYNKYGTGQGCNCCNRYTTTSKRSDQGCWQSNGFIC